MDKYYLEMIETGLNVVQNQEPKLAKIIKKENLFFGFVIHETFEDLKSSSLLIDYTKKMPNDIQEYESLFNSFVKSMLPPKTKISYNGITHEFNLSREYNA
ncbi:MAG TPA: hypothetical protein HA283_03570 [Nanoarchaeota archaeon]|nr:hypothetical protein [Nanoarchaeota archaeon]HIH63350.1 hypothetical protein [Nanoarchaeota archaeon]HIJ09974.1 hypothetical protein [Nanoarchaeota archaeon]